MISRFTTWRSRRPVTTPLAGWPHAAAGRLQINPIFSARKRDGGARLSTWFDNTHFCLQNASMFEYMPRIAEIDAATIAALRGGTRSAGAELLVDEFVVLGLPERFAPDPLA